jgi:hypothetical protein
MKTIRRLKITLSVALLYLLTQLPKLLSPTLTEAAEWAIVGTGFLVAGYVEWARSAPVLRLQSRRRILFDQACKKAMARLREYDDTARLNIMEIDGLPFRQTRYLRIIYDLHVDRRDPDRKMRMQIWQGVAGQAAMSGEFCYGDISDKERGPRFNLNAEQLRKTKDVRLVLSMPIMRAVESGTDEPEIGDKVIGVVNIDSKRADALDFYRTLFIDYESLMHLQEQALREISEYCSFVMS